MKVKILMISILFLIIGCKPMDLISKGEYMLIKKVYKGKRWCGYMAKNIEDGRIDTLYTDCNCWPGDTVVLIVERQH